MTRNQVFSRTIMALLWVLLLAWPFGQLLLLPSPNPQIRWFAIDFVALLLGMTLLFKTNLEKFLLSQPLFKPLAFFLLVLGASLVVNIFELSPQEIFVAGSYWFRLFFFSLIYFALRMFPKEEKKPIAHVSVAIYIALAIGQYVFFPDTRWLANLGFDDHYYRLIGPFFDPNFTGFVMAAGAIIAWHHFHGKAKLIALLPLAGLALTFSRASYLAFAVGLVFLLIRKKWWPVIGLLPILFAMILATPKPFGEGVNLTRTYSIDSRINNQISGITLFVQRPILGHGFNTLAVKSPKYSEKFTPVRVGGIDNSFIYILATSGVVGLLAFIYLVKSLWQLAEWTPPVQAVLLALLVHSWWNNTFFYPWIFIFVLIMADYASLGVPKSK